ncbi:hypothetical protein [Paenibacillus sp. GXUN7292]|uniref:hypothetical protein n=1 Tax=Paenibacillus sp. GXUN7292 TaxID=3422499 RepID=UPI003D7CA73C
MITAYLPDSSIINAQDYDEKVHGYELYCIDDSCRAPVIFVGKGLKHSAYFKTVGRGADSKHKATCGFYEPLDVAAAIDKTAEYQAKLLKDMKYRENIRFVRLNMNSLDPDHVPTPRGEREQKEKDASKLGLKEEKSTPDVISSMKSVVKLLTQNEPDVLSSIYFNISGRKLPLSEVVLSPQRAYDKLWSDQDQRLKYFVYGKVLEVTTREKVTYLDVESERDKPFTLVVFRDYYKNFTSFESFDVLKGRDVLVYGQLKKNDFENRKKCEIIVTTEKYMTLFKRNVSSQTT